METFATKLFFHVDEYHLDYLTLLSVYFIYTFVDSDLFLKGNVRLRLTLLTSNFTTLFNKKRNVLKLIPQNVYGIIYLKDGGRKHFCGVFFFILSSKNILCNL